jgi:hypothetical protein
MKLHKKELKVKDAFKLERERNEIWYQLGKIQQIKLDKPIFKGWKKRYVLRDDVKRRDDAHKIQEVLDRVNTTVYCNNKDFKDSKGRDMHHSLGIIPDPRFWRYYSSSRTAAESEWIKDHRKWIGGTSWLSDCDAHCYRAAPHYHFRNKWMLDNEVTEWYWTHYTPVDPILESRLQEISNKMDHKQTIRIISHARGQSQYDDWYRWPDEKFGDNTVIYQEIQEALHADKV